MDDELTGDAETLTLDNGMIVWVRGRRADLYMPDDFAPFAVLDVPEGIGADDMETIALDFLGESEAHVGHYSRIGGTWYCDTCDSPYCELA